LETRNSQNYSEYFTSCSPFGGIPRNWKLSAVCGLLTISSIGSPFGGIPRNWKLDLDLTSKLLASIVPPSGGSLEIGNVKRLAIVVWSIGCSPFGGIPRNWKLQQLLYLEPHRRLWCSPFGGIPRNWKHENLGVLGEVSSDSPFGGIPRNWKLAPQL